ncbi:MAG: MucR family transcriptional regulator [Rickettsiales bacterium]|jgi:predicted transcriptional regulator|nr:MucR family transcriptional regulator [Rickettsiales bacterium]
MIDENTLILATAKICQGLGDKKNIADIVANVHAALAGLAREAASPSARPAADIKDSIHPDYIVCLEDGAKLKMLKRYLKTRYSMTDKQYKEKWGLPSDYPMVAPNYAKRRSSLAKKFGFGTGHRK